MKKYKGLTKKTTLGVLVGLGLILAITPKVYINRCENKRQYKAALCKTKELAEYDKIPGTSSSEWLSFYRQIGKNTMGANLRKPTLEEMEQYLGKFGFSFNGDEYTDDITLE